MPQAGLTARGTFQADAKAEHSEPTIRLRSGGRLTDRSYSGDNRLVPPKSPYRRRSSAPRCRLNLSWRWRSCQGFGCSPIKKLRELGSNRGAAFSYQLSAVRKRLLHRLNPFEFSFSEKIESTKTRRRCVAMRIVQSTNIGEIQSRKRGQYRGKFVC